MVVVAFTPRTTDKAALSFVLNGRAYCQQVPDIGQQSSRQQRAET